jgi:hypothetical protein
VVIINLTDFFFKMNNRLDGGSKLKYTWPTLVHTRASIGRVFFAKGVLAVAKNGDELFWEEKFHATNMEGYRFHGSQCVPTMFPFKFPMGSHQVSNMFPNRFSIAPPHFYPICFWQMLSSFRLSSRAKGRNRHSSKRKRSFACMDVG